MINYVPVVVCDECSFPFHFHCDSEADYLINSVELIRQKHIQVSVMKSALLS